jgi:hypothetical protein
VRFWAKIRESTPFSDFIRKASAEEKKKVYSAVLKQAAEQQRAVIERAKKHREIARA